MNKADRETPGSFLALAVGIFIGAMFVLPMFAYMCRVNGQLRQENQRLNVRVAMQDLLLMPTPYLMPSLPDNPAQVNGQVRPENLLRTPVVRLSPPLQKHGGPIILYITADQMKFRHFGYIGRNRHP
jgi:hypothetical protein